jgi:hypothetical protein
MIFTGGFGEIPDRPASLLVDQSFPRMHAPAPGPKSFQVAGIS